MANNRPPFAKLFVVSMKCLSCEGRPFDMWNVRGHSAAASKNAISIQKTLRHLPYCPPRRHSSSTMLTFRQKADFTSVRALGFLLRTSASDHNHRFVGYWVSLVISKCVKARLHGQILELDQVHLGKRKRWRWFNRTLHIKTEESCLSVQYNKYCKTMQWPFGHPSYYLH